MPKAGEKLPIGSDIIVAGFGRVKRGRRNDGALRKFVSKVSKCKVKDSTLTENVFCDQMVRGYAACNVSSYLITSYPVLIKIILIKIINYTSNLALEIIYFTHVDS